MHTATNNLDLCWDTHVRRDRCHVKVRDPTLRAAEESIKCHQQPFQKSKGLDNLRSRVPTFAWDLWGAYRAFPKFWAFCSLRPLTLCWWTERLCRRMPVTISSSPRYHPRSNQGTHVALSRQTNGSHEKQLNSVKTRSLKTQTVSLWEDCFILRRLQTWLMKVQLSRLMQNRTCAPRPGSGHSQG